MADSKLRLSIVTALDNAGLKMTKEQIDKLEDSLQKLNKNNNSGDIGGLSKGLTGINGKLGKLVEGFGSIGKAAGVATAAIAVFKEGFELGGKIREWLGERIDLFKTEEQILKQNQELEQQRIDTYNQELDLITKVAQKKNEIYTKEQNENDKAIQSIDNKTKAYFRQVEALTGLNKNIDDAKAIQLERDKFEDMTALQSAGYSDAAEQIGKAYDVMIQQLKVENQLRDVQQDRSKLIKQNAADEDKFLMKMEAVSKAELRLKTEEEKLAQIGKTDRGEKYKKQEELVKQQRSVLEKREAQAYELAGKLQENKYLLQSNDITRSNVAASGSLEVDRLAAAYDQYVLQNGNPLGADIDENWTAELLKNTIDSNKLQSDMLDALKDVPDMLQQLLQIKQ